MNMTRMTCTLHLRNSDSHVNSFEKTTTCLEEYAGRKGDLTKGMTKGRGNDE